jgi:hypothetical protein
MTFIHGCAANATGDFFAGWAYHHNDNQLQPRGRWRGFGDRNNEAAGVDHAQPPFLSEFDAPPSPAVTSDHKNDLFFNLYQANQPWTGLFGANAPDEDFVESYVFNVLTAATPPLTRLPVTLTYSNGSKKTVDVPRDFFSATGKKPLKDRLGCAL